MTYYWKMTRAEKKAHRNECERRAGAAISRWDEPTYEYWRYVFDYLEAARHVRSSLLNPGNDPAGYFPTDRAGKLVLWKQFMRNARTSRIAAQKVGRPALEGSVA